MKARIYFCASLLLWAGTLLAPSQPAAPLLVSPASNAVNVSDSPALKVRVSEPGNGNLTVRYFGRLALSPGPDFTMVVMPDTQCYSAEINGGKKEMMFAQTEWAISNRVSRNVAYVTQLGDISNNGDTPSYIVQWYNATNAMYRLENPVRTQLPDGMAYGVAVGNHEQTPNGNADSGTTTNFNKHFGVPHFTGRGYYAGHYGTNNNNHFDLFSAGGLDFIALYFEYDTTPSAAVLDWANQVLATNATRRVIAVTHYMGTAATPGSLSAQGSAIYNALKANTNLFLMLGGHTCGDDGEGEGSRSDTYNGNTTYTLISDYQCRTNGGNGLMRLMEFSPSNNVVVVQTYSPWTGEYETDENSEFFFPYAMPPSVPASTTNFTELHTESGVPSGSVASFVWSGLLPYRTYEWYVTVTDASNHTVTGPVWRFTTWQPTAPHGASAGLLEVSQIPGFSGEDENTNCLVTLALGINDFQVSTFNRADYSVQSGWSATDDPPLGVLIGAVAQNGRNNYGSNVYSTCGIATNANGSYRLVSYGCANGVGGDGFEYNVNVASAWFPYKEYLGGFVRNSAGANGGSWDLFTGSPGLVLGTHLVPLGGGQGIVDLRSLGIDARTNGVLLVNHAKDEGNYALAQVNSANGTWNVFVHDNSTDGSTYEQDPLAFVFVPRTDPSLISGRFRGDGTPLLYSGATPQFVVTNLGPGQWELRIPGHAPTNGVLIISPEGGQPGNQDNIVTYEPSAAGDSWIIESRDLPACTLETPGGGSESVASFVFIPVWVPEIIAQPKSQEAILGGSAAFSVLATGEMPLYYQWLFNGAPIPGATATSYVRTNVQMADLGGYSVKVSNSFGTVSSLNAVLYVNGTLLITGHPQSQAVPLGQGATITVGVSGTPPLSYQWYFNGKPLAGATASSCVFPAVSGDNAGSYFAVVQNVIGSLVSSNATLGVIHDTAWGDNLFGQGSSSGLGANLIGIAAGTWHNLGLAADGGVIAWGEDSNGQCDVPPNLTNALAVAAGGYHSLAVRANGTVLAWGVGDYGQTNVPAGLADVIGIAAGTWHCVALRANGTVVAWGDNSFGQSDPPAGLTNVTAVAAGGNHTLALKANGTVVAWGENTDAEGNAAGQSVVPLGLTNVVAIGAGDYHSLAVKADGTVVAWGDDAQGQCRVPAGLTNIVAVAGGGAHSVALAADGTMAAWGANWNGQCDQPSALAPVSGVAAGEHHTAVMLADCIPVPRLLSPTRNRSQFRALIQTLSCKHYALEFNNSVTASNWTALSTNTGNGQLRVLTDPNATTSPRFYRMRQW